MVVALALTGGSAALATGDTSASMVVGKVVSFATNQPVGGATIRLPQRGLVTRSGPDGRFRFPTAVPAQQPYTQLHAVVTAAGFGQWSVRGVPLYPGQTLELYAELRSHDWNSTTTLPPERTDSSSQSRSASVLTGKTCTGWDHKLMPPPTIKVFISSDQVAKQYDFHFYATHVLPSEWIPSWDPDALAAGAVAVKTYAAFRTMTGNARTDGPDCYDILDGTSDQVFNPVYSYPTTDAAVDAAMGSVLLRDGDLFLAQYWSGSSSNSSLDWKKCAYVDQDPFVGRMSQWGTQACAVPSSAVPPSSDPPKVWPDIVRVFYTGTNWRYPHNVLLNPGVDAEAGTAPWVAGPYTALDVRDKEPYGGTWRMNVKPSTAGKWAWVAQTVPVPGDTTTTYHAEAALRCPNYETSDCVINVKVKAMPDSGSTIIRTLKVTLHRDSHWHVIRFDPTAAGVAHQHVQLYVSSAQTFWADSLYLDFPYGGP
jgi:hypothetical protein